MRGRRVSGLLLAVAAGMGAWPGCADDFGVQRSRAHLLVSIEAGNRGTPDARLPLSFDEPTSFTVKVVAQRADGTTDDAFNGFVRLSSKPGAVAAVDGPATDGRNVRLVNGVASGVVVSLIAAYGDTRIWAEDLGYVPGDPTKSPQCANGVDDNGNGLIDFPADPGCQFANDDTEDGGTYVAGVSDPLYFISPRIADVRGVNQGGAATAFPAQQVEIDTGYRGAAQGYAFDTVVTRVSSDGFYATDLADPRGFTSIFAFNFSAPPRMRICDRLKSFGGTTNDFFGFTEVNYPTWTLEEWDPTQRPCLVPEPVRLHGPDLNVKLSAAPLLRQEAALVRVETVTEPPPAGSPAGALTTKLETHVAHELGPNFPTYVANADGTLTFKFTPDATNCDLNRDGKVDFNHDPEQSCGNQCTADVECSEYSSYASRNAFRLVVTDSTYVVKSNDAPDVETILADASSSAQFDPVLSRGAPVRSFSGTLRYFSGGQQFTIEARCIDDIVTDFTKAPIPSDTACVHARTTVDLNAASN